MSDPIGDHEAADAAEGADAGDARRLVVAGAGDPVRGFAEALWVLQSQAVTGGLGAAARLSADVVSLARLRHVLDREIARRVRVAEGDDVLPTTARTVLRQQQWSAREARQTTTAARFADTWPQIGSLWSAGQVGIDVVYALAVTSRPLTRQQLEELLQSLIPQLPSLDAGQVRRAVRHAIELVRPDDGVAKEHDDYDRRHLAWSTYRGVVSLTGELPALEGAAFTAAITALAEALRGDGDGDGLTLGQRRADALAALVARAAAGNTLPTAAGLPAAASVLFGLSEAERVAAGHPRTRCDSLGDAAAGVGGTRQAVVGDPDATLGDAATRFLLCAAELTGILTTPTDPHTSGGGSSARTALATALGLTRLQPLAVGRRHRLATASQRKALAVRDQTCFMPGCSIPANQCQPHHVLDWADNGATDLDNLASACWSHHRQLDLRPHRTHPQPHTRRTPLDRPTPTPIPMAQTPIGFGTLSEHPPAHLTSRQALGSVS
ncbi:MAG: DUF222 domain-containing protein [Candidatus Nanopelagicales bacterium]